jgi:hypothetical protein
LLWSDDVSISTAYYGRFGMMNKPFVFPYARKKIKFIFYFLFRLCLAKTLQIKLLKLAQGVFAKHTLKPKNL